MYRNPTAARPLLFIASACASILAAVGLRRMKLQLLHPSAGVSPTPLLSARTGAVAPVNAAMMEGRNARVVASASNRGCLIFATQPSSRAPPAGGRSRVRLASLDE